MFHDMFEGSTSDWTGRGAASITLSGRTAYAGKESLLAQDRTAAWNGTGKALNAKILIPGNFYSFSANVMYFDGAATDKFYLKLQYTDKNGDTHYAVVAEGTALKGEWTQLANTNYLIPADASDMILYVETADSTNNFYLDESIAASAGTVIAGAEQTQLRIKGDVNGDGTVNIFDLTLAKKGILSGFSDKLAEIAADIDENGSVDASDLKQMLDYLHGRIKSFTVNEQNIR